MVVPSKTYVSRSDGWSFGLSDVFDCQVRRYLDAGESFHWRDLLMLTEMALAAFVSEIYLARVLPSLGLVSNSSAPIAAMTTRPLVFFMAPVSYLFMYAMVCGSIHYIYTRKYPEEGQKLSIQNKPMTDLEMRRAIVFSVKSILSVSAASSYAFYAIQGWTNLHWGMPSWKDIPCFLLAYILVDISAYVVHRMLHRPWWYRYVHKAHHLWKNPNAFVVSPLHPAEFLSLTVPTLSVISALPMSLFSAMLLLSWIFTCNAIDHSGLRLDEQPFLAWLVWQAPVEFHDNHHKFFHANYGAMVDWWDRLGGTFYSPKEHGNIGLSEDEFRSARVLRMTR